MSRIDLPGGAWAELASPKKVQERKRRRYVAAMADLSSATSGLPQIPNPKFGQPGQNPMIPDLTAFGSAEMELSDRVGDMLILCLVREWSYGDVNEQALADLEADAFDVLFKACRELAADLLPDYSPDPDPKASTSGSPPSPPGLSEGQSTSTTLLSAATS